MTGRGGSVVARSVWWPGSEAVEVVLLCFVGRLFDLAAYVPLFSVDFASNTFCPASEQHDLFYKAGFTRNVLFSRVLY